MASARLRSCNGSRRPAGGQHLARRQKGAGRVDTDDIDITPGFAVLKSVI